jgi:NAD(P)-dependent dehydrogenase (short-subunit alcohol dehydrogenase family)
MTNPQDLKNQTALVTGGSRGIGASAALALAERGASVHIADRLACEETVRTIQSSGGSAQGHELDIRDQQGCIDVVKNILNASGRLDILVCNAGVCPSGTPTGNRKQWNEVIDINLHGTQNCIEAVWELMQKQGGGRIVMVSSMAYYQGGVIVGTEYTASKAALVGMTRHLARNGGPYGILCNAVAPGIIETEMTRDFAKPDLNNIPLRRLGTAQDVAGPISFLCGPESAYMTGTVLNVTGGVVLAS